MRVFRATYNDRRGRRREASRWYVEFRDADEVVRRIPAFKDRAASEELGRKLESLVALRSTRQAPTGDMARWLATLSPSLAATLLRLSLLDASSIAGSRMLAVLLEEFQEALRARGRTEKWIGTVSRRAGVTFRGCGFTTLADLRAAAVERHLHGLRGLRAPMPGAELATARQPISSRESNHRLQACREFSRWAVHAGLLAADPLASLRPVNARLDPKHVRRALRADDVLRLVQAAHDGPEYRGVAGPVRALVWRLAVQVGLRVGEIQSLQVRDVDLHGVDGPTLTVRAIVSKNRTEARLPLAADLATDLAPFLTAKLPTASVLPLPTCFRSKATRWLRFDLAATGIPYADDSGRIADVHALRSAFVSALVRSGANVKTVQTLARHSSPTMTLGVYARLDARDERDAIRALPSFTPAKPGARQTGTDGEGVLPSCLASDGAEACRSVPFGAAQHAQDADDTVTASCELVEAVGIEPTSRRPCAPSVYVCVPRFGSRRSVARGRATSRPAAVVSRRSAPWRSSPASPLVSSLRSRGRSAERRLSG